VTGSTGEAIRQQRADVRPMIMLHDALRREFRLLPALVRGVSEGSTERAGVICWHIGFLTAVLHAHHRGEDAVLWPILLERGPQETAQHVRAMERHHSLIDQLTGQVAMSMADWRASADAGHRELLAAALDQLIAVLGEHLGEEEQHMLPAAAKLVTQAEWDQMGRAAGTQVDPALVPVGLGMLMHEGDPEVVAADMARMPAEARESLRKTAPQAYEAHSRRVHGTLPPRSGD
jgi:hemerythrin-like domain-containing protein